MLGACLTPKSAAKSFDDLFCACVRWCRDAVSVKVKEAKHIHAFL